jgi:tRNA threonylcarbamoyladenosine biosynthesis protein TsaE
MPIFKSASAVETKEFAAKFATKIIKAPLGKHARVITLLGDLGAGKTTFIQGFAKALGIKNRLTSPTFVIMKRYPLKGMVYNNLYHLDAYRVAHIKDLAPLQFDEILKNPANIVLIEWANNLKNARFKKPIRISFNHGKTEHERAISVNNI